MQTDTLQSLGALRGLTRHERGLLLDCGTAQVALTVLTPQLVHIRLAPTGTFAPRRSWAVAQPDEAFERAPWHLEADAATLQLTTSMLAVEIERDPCRIAFFDSGGRRFCADQAGMAWSEQRVTTTWHLADDEHLYGFGERTAPLDRRGRTITNWATDPPFGHGPGSDPLYMAIPVFMGLRPSLAYGVFFNNSYRSQIDAGNEQPTCLCYEAQGGELDYYVALGPTPAGVLQQLSMLLGTMPLPPRWALGYHQSRWGYKSAAELRTIAREFRLRAIPCDAIHLDIDYMHGYRVFTWDNERFPDPAGLISELRTQGFRTVTIIDPGVKADPAYAVYQAGLQHDYFVHRADGAVAHGYVWPDDAVFTDYLRPEARAWWGDLHAPLAQQGVSGIWCDMNEPTVFSRPFSAGGGNGGTLPLDAPQGPADEPTTHAEAHNLYGLLMARSAYEGMRRATNERPFILTRSAFAGIQRWSACWMGDNSSWWEHLELTLPQLLSMGLSGVPFVGVDIGGFTANASGELFARWAQLGAFLPFCRGHSHTDTQPHEPWAFGYQVEAIVRDALALRYSLLPYFYTLCWEAAQQGSPILRPLFYHYPDDQATYTIQDQALVGPNLLIAPITRPGYEHRYIYLPAGTWYDWWSGAKLEGPTHLLARAPLERMPIYVRGGAILPRGPQVAHTAGGPVLSGFDLYAGDGDFTLYEDDGLSFAYEQGAFSTTRIELRQVGTRLRITIGPREGGYQPGTRRMILHIHGIDAQQAARLPNAIYDAARRMLTVPVADEVVKYEL